MLWLTFLHVELLHFSSPPPIESVYCLQSQSSTSKRLKSSLLPFPPLGSFPTFVGFHGVLDPIVSKQTQHLHYSSPIPICGLQTQGDQYNV
jgi:hypothetical protein